MTIYEIFTVLAVGAGLILWLAIVLTGGVILYAVARRSTAALDRLDHDPRVLAFGRSPVGVGVNKALASLLPYVDESTDPLISTVLQMPILKSLHDAGLITADDIQRRLEPALLAAIKLTDGIAG